MMRKVLVVVVFLFATVPMFSQELNATVSVNYQQVANGNPQLFKNLENQVKEFLNTTKWTTKEYTDVEKIDCNFFINNMHTLNNSFNVSMSISYSTEIRISCHVI